MAAEADRAGTPPVARSRLGTTAAVLAVGTDLLYLGIIVSQDPVDWARVIFFSGAIALAGAAAGAASIADLTPAIRLMLFAAAAGCLLSLGVIGLFSVGLPLFVAGILCAIAWQRAWAGVGSTGPRRWLPSVLAFAAAALVPLAGTIGL